MSLHYQEVDVYFRHWLRQDGRCEISVCVPEEDIEAEYKRYPAGAHPGNAELTAMVYHLSDKLLPLRKVFFHGLAVLLDGKAWIFTGPSGIGKTTQYRLLKKLHGAEVELICGDKPIIEASTDGGVLVHPTPWNGKENYRSCMKQAPLGGIICLRQDSANTICAMPHLESIVFLYRQMMFLPDSRENILMAGEILSAMVKSAPVWFLSNKGDVESSELVYSTIIKPRSGSDAV